jgi:N-methylhydantoinase A
MFRIGVDVGGTFTDFLLLNDQGQASVFKTPSTPADPSIGVLNGFAQMAAKVGLSLEDFAAQVDLIVHGTTVTTNAVLTGGGVKTGLITTQGFRDILEMRRGYREKVYDNRLTPPAPLVPRNLRLGVAERITIDGEVATPLDEASLLDAIDRLKQENLEALAVCFMHSYANPAHEQAAKEIIEREMPDVFLTVSSELLPQARLYERVSTAALNCYVGPVLRKYLRFLAEALDKIGFAGVLLIMQSNGGVATPQSTARTPVMTLLSGPAGGPVAGISFSAVQGYDQCITVDMGGTSFDAALIQNGEPLLRSEGWINRQRLALPMLDIHTIGSGGGSIGWIDDGGLLRMGPQSAGADPGPACYGKGGTRPTCTDANLVLGYLNPDYFLGGDMALDVEAARRAIESHIAAPMGLSVEDAAAGMFHLMNINMAAGLREISVSRGVDPREYPLIVAGGAGPVHGAMIALEIEIPLVLVPRDSSIFCASGMLRSDLKHSYVRTYYALASRADPAAMLDYLSEMEAEGRRVLKGERVDDERRLRMEYAVDMRYLGQHNEITVDFERADFEKHGIGFLCERFHEEHDRLYGYSLKGTDTEMEFVNLRLTAFGITQKPEVQKMDLGGADASKSLKGSRPVYIPGEKAFRDIPVYDGETLTYGNRASGPAIIEQITTTTFVPPEYDFIVDAAGTYSLYLRQTGEDYLKRVLP